MKNQKNGNEGTGRELYSLYYESESVVDFKVEEEGFVVSSEDTVIRVLMTYKGLDEPIEVEEQELETPERTGFVAVEWGGTEIK